MAVALDRIVLLIAATAMLALAGVTFALDPRRLLHRLLAALLAARGAALLLPQAASDPAWSWAAVETQPYFLLATVPLALALLAVPLDARAPPPSGPPTAAPSPPSSPTQPRSGTAAAWMPRRALGWIALAASTLLGLVYAADHGLMQSLAPGQAASGAMQAAAGIRYTAFGPLTAVAALGSPLLAAVGLRFALAYRARAHTADARTLLMLGGAFLVGALFDGASRAMALADLVDSASGAGFVWLPWGWALAVLPVATIVPALAGLAVLASGRRAESRPLHTTETTLVALGSACGLIGLGRLAIGPDTDPAGSSAFLIFLGLARLALPVLVAGALLAQDRVKPRPAASWAVASGGAAVAGLAASGGLNALGATWPWPVSAAIATGLILAIAGRPMAALAARLVASGPATAPSTEPAAEILAPPKVR